MHVSSRVNISISCTPFLLLYKLCWTRAPCVWPIGSDFCVVWFGWLKLLPLQSLLLSEIALSSTYVFHCPVHTVLRSHWISLRIGLWRCAPSISSRCAYIRLYLLLLSISILSYFPQVVSDELVSTGNVVLWFLHVPLTWYVVWWWVLVGMVWCLTGGCVWYVRLVVGIVWCVGQQCSGPYQK